MTPPRDLIGQWVKCPECGRMVGVRKRGRTLYKHAESNGGSLAAFWCSGSGKPVLVAAA